MGGAGEEILSVPARGERGEEQKAQALDRQAGVARESAEVRAMLDCIK